jgi:glutathione S-transferase
MALLYAQIHVKQCEVDFKNKPQDLLIASAKGTVPVLILENGRILDESIDIIKWALEQSDPDGWMRAELKVQCEELIYLNDSLFKPILDNYKYPQKSEKKDPIYYREQAKTYLCRLNLLLMQHRYLLANHISLADISLFPFIRQFYMVDKQWFEESEYTSLTAWLESFLNSSLFIQVMVKKQV